MTAVANKWRSLLLANEELWGDHSIVLEAVSQDGEALAHASRELKGKSHALARTMPLNFSSYTHSLNYF